MARQFSMPYQIPPVSLLPPAADAAGRTGPFRDLNNAMKAWVVARVNQGNAAQVTVSLLQAQDVSGTGAKAAGAVPVWLNTATAASDALAVQPATPAYQTTAALADKIVVFEITPEMCLDVANGFRTVAVQTSASNAANVTSAELFVLGASASSSYV
jgi:hypothetical protein